jgi:hypothetical protein
VLSAMLTVLAATLGRVPTAVMRSKLGGASALLAAVLGEAGGQVGRRLGLQPGGVSF